MLKFQDDYTTLIATFEDFILLVYTIVDDLYRQVVPVSVSHRRNVHTAKMSDSEIITLSICGELTGTDSETKFQRYFHSGNFGKQSRTIIKLIIPKQNGCLHITLQDHALPSRQCHHAALSPYLSLNGL